jgi:hypothetical protein
LVAKFAGTALTGSTAKRHSLGFIISFWAAAFVHTAKKRQSLQTLVLEKPNMIEAI